MSAWGVNKLQHGIDSERNLSLRRGILNAKVESFRRKAGFMGGMLTMIKSSCCRCYTIIRRYTSSIRVYCKRKAGGGKAILWPWVPLFVKSKKTKLKLWWWALAPPKVFVYIASMNQTWYPNTYYNARRNKYIYIQRSILATLEKTLSKVRKTYF